MVASLELSTAHCLSQWHPIHPPTCVTCLLWVPVVPHPPPTSPSHLRVLRPENQPPAYPSGPAQLPSPCFPTLSHAAALHLCQPAMTAFLSPTGWQAPGRRELCGFHLLSPGHCLAHEQVLRVLDDGLENRRMGDGWRAKWHLPHERCGWLSRPQWA